MGGDPRVTKSSSVQGGGQSLTVDDRMMDILNNPRLSENAKVAELQKSVANLSEPEKQALYERLKNRKSKDPLVQQFHYRLSHSPWRAGGVSTTDQVLNTLKPAASKQSAATQDTKSTTPGKGPSPALTDSKTADALARDRILSQEATGLKPGESINATVTTTQDIVKPLWETTFDFSKPVTRDQAAAIIFQNGKVPERANFIQGPGNKWTVQYPNGMESKARVAKHFNSHTETVVTRNKLPGEMFYPEPHVTFSWVGGARATGTPVTPRRDLKNDFGFVVNKKYVLDEGQSPHMNVRTLVNKGPGYELVFEKPMTKSQIKEKLFEKDVRDDQVRLIPVPQEPTSVWQVQLLDGETPLKRPAGYALMDANVYGKTSIAPSVPAGIKAHIQNQTVPDNAKKFPPNVYVWEQEGHIVRVETNGKKGKDAYYQYEETKLHPTDQQGNNTMRWLMMEKGLPVRKAWQEYIKHWDEIHTGMMGMVGGGARFTPRGMGVGTPRSSFHGSGGSRGGSKPSNTIVATPPPPPKPYTGPNLTANKGTIVSNPPPVRPRPQGPKPSAEPAPPAQQPVDGKNIVAGRGKTLPGAIYRKHGNIPDPVPAPAWFPKKSGAKLTNAQVKELHNSDRGRIGWSMTRDEHIRQWKNANPNSKEPPPAAFTTRDGKVQVSEEMWTGSGEKPLWGIQSQ